MDFENNYNPQGAQPQGPYNQEPPQPQAYDQNPQYAQPQAYSQDPQYAQPQAYSQDPQYAQPVTFDLNAPQEPPKKKGKKGLIIGLIAGVTALVATFVSLFIFTDIFKRPPSAEKRDETVKGYLTSSADKLASGLSLFSASDSVGSSPAAEIGNIKMDMQLEVGDDLLSLLTPSLEQAGIDADFLKNVDLKWDVRGDDSRAQYLLGLFVSDKEIATVDMIMDLQNSAMYLGLPGLNPYYMQADLSEFGLDAATMQQSTALMQGFAKAVPTEQELQTCFRSYIDLLLKQMEDYETADKTVEIDGAKQKLYTITYHISADDLLEMLEACLNQAKDDKTLEKLLTAYGNYINSIMASADPYSTEKIDLYAEFVTAVEDALYALESADADDENFMELTVYMDKDSKTRGIEWVLSDDGDEWTPFYWVTVTDKKQKNTEIILSDPYEEGITITGGQTIEKGVGNGTYVIAVEGEDVMEIELVNFISNEETTSGSIRLYPSADLMDEAASDGMSMLLKNLGFQIDLGKDSFGIHLISGDDILIGISTKVTATGKNIDVKLPDNILNGYSAAEDWAAELDLDTLMERLEKAGIPSELLESIPLT